MPNWKKVIISGSDAALNTLDLTGDLNITEAATPTITLTDTTNSSTLTLNTGNFDSAITSNGRLFINSSTGLTVSAAGNVGVGVSNPITSKFQVTGTSYLNGLTAVGTTPVTGKSLVVRGTGTTSATTALLVEDSAGADLLEVNDQGNVTIPNGSLSINGASNTEQLNIQGNLFFEGASSISAGGVGDSLTLQAQSANIAIGYPGAADITMTGGVTGSFSGSFEGDGTNLTGITAEWDGSLNGDAEITGSLTVKTGDLFVSGSTVTNITPAGEVVLGYENQPVQLNRNKFVLVNSGTAPVAIVDGTVFPSAHFDYVIVKGTNLRAGTVMACHDGLSNVVFTEVSTADLGSTAGVTLDVIETGGNLTLQMTVPSTGWNIKTFVRGI